MPLRPHYVKGKHWKSRRRTAVPVYSSSSPVELLCLFKSKNPMKSLHPLQVSVIQCLCTHHAAVQLLWVRVCPHPLLRLAVCAALAVEASGRWTRAGQGRVEGAGRQWAGKEVIVWAQVVPLDGRWAGQAEILVVGTSTSTADPGAGERLLPSQHPDLNIE